MKKIILAAVAVFAFGSANAQEVKEAKGEGFAKGDVFVTGAVSFESTNNKNTEEKTSYFEIAPQVNYFVTENISLGAKIGFTSDKAEESGDDTQDLSSVSFGLAGRYYFTPASKFSLFGELSAEYVTMKDNLSTPEIKANGFGAGLGLGLNYFVSSNFSIEAGLAVLNFASAKADVEGAKEVSEFSFGGDLRAVSFGVNYKF
jgi:opacity protein-like surface antigen